jgi:hypothetical protein
MEQLPALLSDAAKRRVEGSRRARPAGLLAVSLLLAALPAAAQLTPPPQDPLARMRAAAAASNNQTCSVSETSACAQANPKIISTALGSSVLADHLRGLEELGARVTGTPGMDRAVAWAVSAFRDAGMNEVSVEDSYVEPPETGPKQKNVVAEIRGREKPDEFVLMGANLDSGQPGAGPDNACNVALLLEAARDIHLTGLRPRRSIRFVLFSGKEQGMLGSWAYVRVHRAALDRAVAAVIFDGGCGRVTGFSLGGRRDIEAGIRDSLEPLASWNVAENTYDALASGEQLDFLLEGVPNLVANREEGAGPRAASPTAPEGVDGSDLRRSAAIAGVLAFGLAEHAAPLGPRLSRAEVESLVKQTGLDEQMRQMGLWRSWESGQRGRQP